MDQPHSLKFVLALVGSALAACGGADYCVCSNSMDAGLDAQPIASSDAAPPPPVSYRPGTCSSNELAAGCFNDHQNPGLGGPLLPPDFPA